MLDWLGSLIGGALGLTSNALGGVMSLQQGKEYNKSQENIVSQANQTNRDIAAATNAQNLAIQEENWARDDNAVQRRAADLQAAGLSKTLAAGSAAGNTASFTAQTGPSTIVPNRENPANLTRDISASIANTISNSIDQFYAHRLKDRDLDIKKAQADANIAMINKDLDIAEKEEERKAKMFPHLLEQLQHEILNNDVKLGYDVKETLQRIKKLEYENEKLFWENPFYNEHAKINLSYAKNLNDLVSEKVDYIKKQNKFFVPDKIAKYLGIAVSTLKSGAKSFMSIFN